MWNQTIPDALRGRLAGIEMVSYLSGPLLGHVEAGAVAAVWGVRASVVSGGVLCVAARARVRRAAAALRARTTRAPLADVAGRARRPMY